jgi:segregation and condensation protein A
MDGINTAPWDEKPWQRATPDAAPVLSVEGFEGPLDWLLELARTRRIDLARLSIAALIEAFATALTAALAQADARPLTLARWGLWLVMAADLALLRSRLLVPDDPAQLRGAEDTAEILRQRLLTRAATATAADWLEHREQVGRTLFPRGQADRLETERAGQTADLTALLRACLAVIRLPPDAASRYSVPAPPAWSMADAAARMRALLRDLGEGGAGMEAFLPEIPDGVPDRQRWCRSAVAATFGAGLEMARNGELRLGQGAAFANIAVDRG